MPINPDDYINGIVCGDVLQVLKDFPTGIFNCCVTSPPYWSLRDYEISGQLGQEETYQEYIAHMVEVFDEVKRVLRKDGVFWLNIGDTYSAGGYGGTTGTSKLCNGKGTKPTHKLRTTPRGTRKRPEGMRSKDLLGIPWTLAFALREHGWIIRCDIIWNKPNGMPQSVKDRPLRTHEYLFMLVQSEKYWFDYKAIRVPALSKSADGMKTLRSVWDVNTVPYAGAHCAAYPPKLIEPCILSSCPEGGLVLDPFMGSGTTGMVAGKHRRNFIGIEKSEEYVKAAYERIKNDKYMES